MSEYFTEPNPRNEPDWGKSSADVIAEIERLENLRPVIEKRIQAVHDELAKLQNLGVHSYEHLDLQWSGEEQIHALKRKLEYGPFCGLLVNRRMRLMEEQLASSFSRLTDIIAVDLLMEYPE